MSGMAAVGARASLKPEGPMRLDGQAPAAVKDLQAQRLDRVLVTLAWTPPADDDCRYHHVYYAAGTERPAISQAARIASLPVGLKQYVDFASKPGAAGVYAVTTIDRFGNESPPEFASVPAERGR